MKIKDAEKVSHVNAYSIRFYEKKGLLNVKRDGNGVRDFDHDALERLEMIRCYRCAGLTLKEIEEVFDGHLTLDEYLNRLQQTKQRLHDQIAELENTEKVLDQKIRDARSGKRHPEYLVDEA